MDNDYLCKQLLEMIVGNSKAMQELQHYSKAEISQTLRRRFENGPNYPQRQIDIVISRIRYDILELLQLDKIAEAVIEVHSRNKAERNYKSAQLSYLDHFSSLEDAANFEKYIKQFSQPLRDLRPDRKSYWVLLSQLAAQDKASRGAGPWPAGQQATQEGEF